MSNPEAGGAAAQTSAIQKRVSISEGMYDPDKNQTQREGGAG